MINFEQIVDQICLKSPLQKKKLKSYLSTRSVNFFNEADKFTSDYSSYLESQGLSFEYAIDAYLKMCKDMVKSQIYFMKMDKYPLEDQDQAFDEVYNSKDEMQSFMVGLALSQYLWGTHYEMFRHFTEGLQNNKKRIKSYLEIGPGHGLFFKKAIETIGNNCKYTAVDISSTSLNLTESIVSFFQLSNNNINFFNEDMLSIDTKELYDFIVMGEVLEHVENPNILLDKLNSILADNGKAFISTCVNCPTIDHVYHYKSIGEIQRMIKNSGFLINDERILPVENLEMEDIVEKKIAINYSAIISRQK
ncbi:class I SAM-dependent methyltransferase [Candidatus Woesearchaeota archaeon]|jgi:SAM-dependent methyltransferase|nr:class I SAM-dependent methyltransferase [Candidatus Woesearchaeota archaeon]